MIVIAVLVIWEEVYVHIINGRLRDLDILALSRFDASNVPCGGS